MVLKSSNNTKVSVNHISGDDVAEIIIENPPSNALEVMQEQTGGYAHSFEHQSLEANSLTVRAILSNGALNIEAKRIQSPPAWIISFIPNTQLPFPKRSELVGRVVGITSAPEYPVIFPPTPRDNPCTGNRHGELLLSQPPMVIVSGISLEQATQDIVEPICKSWVHAQLARSALENLQNIAPYQRWAFYFATNESMWELHKESYSQASLIAFEVLSRLDYIPEAELVIRDTKRFTSKAAVPKTLSLANHFAHLKKHNKAETLYRELIREGFSPDVLYKASLGRLLNLLDGEDPISGIKSVEKAYNLLPKDQHTTGILWNLGGEGALALGQPILAQKFYARAARSSDTLQQGRALLRLADLEAQIGRFKSANTGWKISKSKKWRCANSYIHLRNVLVNEKSVKEINSFLQKSSRFSLCETVRLEANYAITLINLINRDFEAAISEAKKVIEEGTALWGDTPPHRSLITRVAEYIFSYYDRHRAYAKSIELFERDFVHYKERLTPETRFLVGQAYIKIGASQRAAIELQELLIAHPNTSFSFDLMYQLGLALIKAKDPYRAELVVRHLNTLDKPKDFLWKYEHLAILSNLKENRPKEALKHIPKALAALPSGDRYSEMEFLRAKAYQKIGNPENAAKSLQTALSSPLITKQRALPLSINILSECIRRCSTSVLRKTTESIVSHLSIESIPPRLRMHLNKVSILREKKDDTGEDPQRTLWNKLNSFGIARGVNTKQGK